MTTKLCPVCKQPMRHYFTGWKCMNVKAHAKAGRNANKPGAPARNPKGANQWGKGKSGTPPKPKGSFKATWVLTICISCGNGRRRDPKKCGLCKGYGRIWTIK